jgi:hypothetical protein
VTVRIILEVFGRSSVPHLSDVEHTKYRFPTATYFELRNDRLITFLWAFAVAVSPLFINFIVYSVTAALGQKQLVDYFAENSADATFTGFSIAAVALANSCFNSVKPTTHGQMSFWTHISIVSIAVLALINIIVHVIITVTNAKEPDVYFLAICLTASIALISWGLQVLYVKDITYKSATPKPRHGKASPTKEV